MVSPMGSVGTPAVSEMQVTPNSLWGKRMGKKRMPSCNEADRDGRNTKHVPTRKRADLSEVIQLGILQHETRGGLL